MNRGHYAKISLIDRERLIRCFHENGDWVSLAETLNIKRQTARGIILKYRRTGEVQPGQRGGNRPKKTDQEMVDFLLRLIEEKPTVTLHEMNARLRIQFPDKPQVSHQTISRSLDGEVITVKDVRPSPVQRNTPAVKEERRLFAEWLLADGMGHLKIYADEFGMNIWTARTKGRSRRGERAVRIVDAQRGQNLTIILAINPLWGLIHWKFVEGGNTKDLFSDFLMEISVLLNEPCVILIDNAKPHHGVPRLDDGQEVRFLPRYSPFLNAAEMAGSALKAAVKQRLTEPAVQMEIYERDAPREETLHARRMRVLRRECEAALPEITAAKCSQWFNHTLGYMPLCVRGENIFD